MERAQATKKLAKLLGPKVYWRIATYTSSPEKRERGRIHQLDLTFRRAMLKRDMGFRRDTLLAADAEYQSHLADWHRRERARVAVRCGL